MRPVFLWNDLLGERDIEIESCQDLSHAIKWIDFLALYLVADKPSRSVTDGDGFRLRDSGPRRPMRLRSCSRYEQDEFLYNPYGYIRLVAAETDL